MTTLWIGGTSGLTRTYINQFGSDDLVLLGLESSANAIQCDLTEMTKDKPKAIFDEAQQKNNKPVNKIVIGVRPSLLTPTFRDSTPMKMLQGIEMILAHACREENIDFVLHISSVAAADHLRNQVFISEKVADPPLPEYTAPYDVFKRASEEVISKVCQQNSVRYTHLRISGIFSDNDKCLQCNVFRLQALLTPFVPTPIDHNSSLNVSRAIRSLLNVNHSSEMLQTMYYYTRPLALAEPVPYGYYVHEYKRAQNMQLLVWGPLIALTWARILLHLIANAFPFVPYIEALDYMFQVSYYEHSFDCSRFAKDFPNMLNEEESIYDCFTRRRKLMEISSS
uniref:NAD-dependent epimerase/dehydratase domain-containing protein n=1 Tax=Ditylum brightwellii TaxID=49249 RepID=A0A6S8UGX8_9STRA|mmetsp:Transcript_24389/g.32373  ORF Transcript_24389/g.32373 Transcript_24389/m.32373 type:complete len:338 (+) Transcript_24389:67-1080(+)|eukprot:15366624-Ditylum_brightwellii.AAC.1